jgi:hypothetical protein
MNALCTKKKSAGQGRTRSHLVRGAAALAPLMLFGTFPVATTLMRSASAQQSGDGNPTIVKQSIIVNCQRFTRFRPDPKKEPVYGQWSWSPRLEFRVRGPIAGGSQMSVTFTKPNGAPYLTVPLETPEIPAGESRLIRAVDQPEEKANIGSGLYGFTITMKNELAGTKSTLYSGKFLVKKYKVGQKATETEFYVDHDWLLPIGYLWLNKDLDEEAPPIMASMWFRSEQRSENLAGYLFYQGKQIASTKVGTEGSINNGATILVPSNDADPRWERWDFMFTRARAYRAENRSASSYGDAHFLDKNPGNYEIKILKGGKLARTVSFTIGPDGKIVDNGLAAKNKMNTSWMMYPLTVTPGLDGAADTTDYKTASFYNNPLVGF